MADHCSAVCVHTYDRVRRTAFYGEQCPTVHMSHSCFTHSSAGGQLGYFRVLAVVNSAAMNTGVHASFSVTVPSGHMPSTPPCYDNKFQCLSDHFPLVLFNSFSPCVSCEGVCSQAEIKHSALCPSFWVTWGDTMSGYCST